MSREKTKYAIILATTALFVAFGPFGIEKAHAASILWWSVEEIVAGIGLLMETLCGFLLYLSASVFDFSVETSINNTSIFTGGAISAGWAVSRNVANIALIFIMIYISISTILQLSGPGTKTLLTRLIIIGLLINFSMFIAQTVIGFSNSLAQEFYSAMKPVNKGEISAVFVAQMKLQTTDNVEGTSFGSNGQKPTVVQIALISIFSCALELTAAFVLLAAAVMFIFRAVSLSIIIILAPLAFVAMILQRGEAKTWWTHLINESFFAPAFLFMLYIVAKIINDSSFSNLFGKSQTGYAGLVFDQKNVGLVVQFLVIIGLLTLSLAVAKMMAGKSSEMGLKAAGYVRGKIEGYAGKIGKGVGGLPGAGLRRAAGRPMEAFATGKGKGAFTNFFAGAGNLVRKTPVLSLANPYLAKKAAGVTATNRAKVEEVKKKYDNYTAVELKNMLPTLFGGFERAAAISKLAELKDLKPDGLLNPELIKQSIGELKNYGMSTKAIESLKWQYATKEEVPEVVKTLDAEAFGTILSENRKSIEKGDAEPAFDHFFGKKGLEEILKAMNQGWANKLADESGGGRDKIIETIANKGKTNIEIADKFKKEGNNRLAALMFTPIITNMLSNAGVEIEDKKSKKKMQKTPKEEAERKWKEKDWS
ncbi:MAG: hypothetical protein PHC85_03135 [Candidatus Pacebacteria bacterium]|nr:hypothetical protein [Candidatus Paceibacterota bacterium]